MKKKGKKEMKGMNGVRREKEQEEIGKERRVEEKDGTKAEKRLG